MLLDVGWYLLMLVDAGWCWLILVDAGWCWLMLAWAFSETPGVGSLRFQGWINIQPDRGHLHITSAGIVSNPLDCFSVGMAQNSRPPAFKGWTRYWLVEESKAFSFLATNVEPIPVSSLKHDKKWWVPHSSWGAANTNCSSICGCYPRKAFSIMWASVFMLMEHRAAAFNCPTMLEYGREQNCFWDQQAINMLLGSSSSVSYA